MSFIIRSIFIYIIINILFFVEKINSKNVIKVLIEKPTIADDQYIQNYNQLINQYFTSKNIDYEIDFSYCVPDPADGMGLSFLYQSTNLFSVDVEYAKSYNCTLRELKSANYDMMIVDDKFLFSDESYIKNTIMESMFLFNKLTDFYVSYDKIKKEDIAHHDADIVKDGKLDDKLYGLPYEFDFDLLYYQEEGLKDLLSTKIENLSGLNNLGSDGILDIGLMDNDELINIFYEFIRYQYNLPKENDPKSYDSLYGKDSSKIYDSFREYIVKMTGENTEKTLSTSVLDAFNSFVNGDKKLFKGKASYYNDIKTKNANALVNSLPEGLSVISEKYLVINRNSNNPIDQLVEVALQLTSSDMQLYRAKQLGSIPTFNFKNKSDGLVSSYCGENSVICSMIDQLNPIRITKALRKNMYSAYYLESRLVLPLSLRQSLSSKDNVIIDYTFSNILDIWNNSMQTLQLSPLIVVMMAINGLSFITVGYLLIVILKVYRNRKHPYIKAMSPQLTNITIFGMAIKIVYQYLLNAIRTNYLCRLNVVINFFMEFLIYTPLLAIIFRIYYIYTNVTNMSAGKKLHDKRLIRYILLILVLAFLAIHGITYFDDFYLVTTGSIALTRAITCTYNISKYAMYTNIYTVIMFILMMGMTIKVHKLSKKYGDTKFIFFIVFLLISSFIFQQAFTAYMSTTNIDNVTIITLIIIILQLLTSIITVHLLIGNRILYLRKHPVHNKNKLNNSDFKNINNIVNFIGQKKNMNSSFSYFDSSLNKSSTRSSSETYINMDSTYSKKDPMMKEALMKDTLMSNHSYRPFSSSLQSLNSSVNNNLSVNNLSSNLTVNNLSGSNVSFNDTFNSYGYNSNNSYNNNGYNNNGYNNNNNNIGYSNSNNNGYNNGIIDENLRNKKKNGFNSYYYYNKLNTDFDYERRNN